MTQVNTNGQVVIDGDFAPLIFKRYPSHTPEEVWSALTEPEQLGEWYMATAKIDGRPGGSIDMTSGPSRFHATGRILEWDPPKAYEYEWNVDPRSELPKGEKSVIRREPALSVQGTLLTLTHRRLTKSTALGFAPGTHAFLDRLQAHLDKAPLPDWMRRFEQVQGAYPSWKTGG